MEAIATPDVSTPQHASLGLSDKVGIVNALMAQDRVEVREKQDAIMKLTYYVIPALFATAGFGIANGNLKWLAVLGLVLFYLTYLVAYFTFRRWLGDARACQQIREAFYKHQELFFALHFDPIRSIIDEDRQGPMQDTQLWFPLIVTSFTALLVLAYVLVV